MQLRCNVCYRKLIFDNEHDWYRCRICRNYDMCSDCVGLIKEEVIHIHQNSNRNHNQFYKLRPSLHETVWENHCNNVLSFDGGGIRGYSSLLMFKKYCQGLNPSVPDDKFDAFVDSILRNKFDLVVGTSIGGIISILLALRIPFSKITSLRT